MNTRSARVTAIQDELFSLEEKLQRAELARTLAAREQAGLEAERRRLALDATSSGASAAEPQSASALERYEELTDRAAQEKRRFEMADLAIEYGEERIEGLRRRLRGEIARESSALAERAGRPEGAA